MDKNTTLILQVAIDAPVRRLFDYHEPVTDGAGVNARQLGTRVRVPFGRRRVIGIVAGIVHDSKVDKRKLKTALELIDVQPLFDAATFKLLNWAAAYYHHPVGEVFAAALPPSLRDGQAALVTSELWMPTAVGLAQLAQPGSRRAPRQRALLGWLAGRSYATRSEACDAFGSAALQQLARRGWIESCRSQPADAPRIEVGSAPVALTAAQAQAAAAVIASLGTFTAHLLNGVTGSGKTEVYLHAIAAALAAGGQALVLVPEIALTPQLLARFSERFSSGIAVMHSGLAESERRDAWRAAYGGAARVLIGTRSAVFTSMARLALIIVDEEHDASYKQHEGFRYSARDLAVMRARAAGVPIVLGSATPSLETLQNTASGRYAQHELPQRPGAASAPRMSLVDLRKHACEQGLSTPALLAIDKHLRNQGQIIVFLNRRGYAPSLFCNACGWIAPCKHCDARMTLHRRAGQLRCHHCGATQAVPEVCGSCGHELVAVGQGTERLEETLSRLFPNAPLARLDRDAVSARHSVDHVLQRIHSGEARILIGTQMLTKGHHFPDVSLVIVLDADQGLFASDFRAAERLAQTIIQVAGRAGRASRPGEVIIQTQFPEHPLLTTLIAAGYERFAAIALEERRRADWPPFSRLAMLRAEAKDEAALDRFLSSAAAAARAAALPGVKVLGPASALLARRADYYRAHLLLEAAARASLQSFLTRWLPTVERLKCPAQLRWSLDVDPVQVD